MIAPRGLRDFRLVRAGSETFFGFVVGFVVGFAVEGFTRR